MTQCNYNDFMIVTTGINDGFFMIMTGKESKILQACRRSHTFLQYPAEVEKTLADTLCMDLVRISPLWVTAIQVYV